MKFIVELSGSETIESIEKGTLLSLIKSVEQTELSVQSTGDDAAEPEPERVSVREEPEPERASVREEPVPTTPVPTKTVSYTLDDLQKAAIGLMDNGHRNDLIDLLGKFEIPSLANLPESRYGEFALALRGIGAEI